MPARTTALAAGDSPAAVKEQLQTMDWREFEHLVAELWERQGWKTDVTQGSHDRGVDVYAERPGPVGQTLAIQAKRQAPDNPIDPSDVQQYQTLRVQENVDTVVIVTTAPVTGGAREAAQEFNVRLFDGDDVAQLVCEHEAQDALVEHGGVSPRGVLAAWLAGRSRSLGRIVTRGRHGEFGPAAGWIAIAVGWILFWSPLYLPAAAPMPAVVLVAFVLLAVGLVHDLANAGRSRLHAVWLFSLVPIAAPLYLYDRRNVLFE